MKKNNIILKIQTWCSTWGMKLKPNKTHSIIISRSKTALPPFPYVELNWKLPSSYSRQQINIEMYIRNVATSIAQKTRLICKCFKALDNDNSLLRSFCAYILPCFEYCSPV